MKSRPVLITFSVLAGLQVLTGGSALANFIGGEMAGLFILAVASVQVGMTFFVQNSVVPVQDTAAYVNSQGSTVAGPASGVTNGREVDVVPVPTSPSPENETMFD